MQVLETLGITGLGLAALVIIARQIVLHVFDRDLAAQKAKLDREMQRHSHDLDCLRQQFQIQFSKTYERQVDAVRQLYDAMRQLLSKLDHVSFLIGLDDLFKKSDPHRIHEAIAETTAAHTALGKLYDDTDIYLPSSLSGRMKEFFDTTSSPSVDTHTLFAEHFTKEMVREWQTLWSETKPTVEQLMSDLKTEFRQLHGIDTLGQQPPARDK